MANVPKVGGGGAGGIRVRSPGDLFERPEPALKRVGVLFLSEGEKSFREQRLGGSFWPARQAPNIHGILDDLKHGTSIPERRWQGRPALKNTGALWKSLSPNVSTPLPRSNGPGVSIVQIGTTLPYASLMQEGGEKTTAITPTIRKNLAILMGRKRRSAKLSSKKLAKLRRGVATGALAPDPEKDADLESKSAASSRFKQLGFLFQLDAYTSKIRARPFIGLTDRLREKIVDDLRRYFEGKG